MFIHIISSTKIHSQFKNFESSKTFLCVVVVYLVDSTFLSYFLKFDKTFAITPMVVSTKIFIGFKVTLPAAAPEMMDRANKKVEFLQTLFNFLRQIL